MTEFHLVVSYQYHENYGAHDWDGEGECPQYWKAKGGSDEVIAVLTTAEVSDLGSEGLAALVREKANEHRDDYSEQYVINWELECLSDASLVKVRRALDEARDLYGDDPYNYIGVAIDLRMSESMVKLAMERLEDPNLVLPIEEDDSPWEEYAEAA